MSGARIWSDKARYVSVVCDNSEECTKLFHVFGCLHYKNGFDFLWVWFNATWSEPMSEEIGFLDGSFTFTRVDNKAFFSKLS